MRNVGRSVLGLLTVAAVASSGPSTRAELPGRYPPPAALGDWPDAVEPSAPVAISAPAAAPPEAAPPAAAPRLLPVHYQAEHVPATAPPPTQPAAPLAGPKPLAPPPVSQPIPLSKDKAAPSAISRLTDVQFSPAFSSTASLAIVAGAFLLVVWAVRRGMPKGAAALPREAVEVLGRATLLGRQHVHLVRCGNKLVLLHVTAGGVETLTEITEPAEVDRLHSICQPPAGAVGGLRQWLSRFGDSAHSSAYYVQDGSGNIDFGQLEADGTSRA